MWDEKDILRIKTFAGFLTNDEEYVIWKDNYRGKLSLKIRVEHFQLHSNVIYIITYKELDKEAVSVSFATFHNEEYLCEFSPLEFKFNNAFEELESLWKELHHGTLTTS